MSTLIRKKSVRKEAPVSLLIRGDEVKWLIIGGGAEAYEVLQHLLRHGTAASAITIVAEEASGQLHTLLRSDGKDITIQHRAYKATDLAMGTLVVAATGNAYLNGIIRDEAVLQNRMVYVTDAPQISDFTLADTTLHGSPKKGSVLFGGEMGVRSVVSKLIVWFALMLIGHLIISYLPIPPVKEIIADIRPYFDARFFLFVVAGFIAQMVDGVLSMGYGVTSATCLMSMGVPPVSVSAAIHTAEVFTTGVSGYSHYRFGNVNKKLFKHIVIPGVAGAVLGALLLVWLGEESGAWLMPVMALYAFLLGLKILIKAFQQRTKIKKVKRVGWLAGAGGFLDSFGGGGWGPIVTSTLIAKGKSPKYTVGTVSLTEFFVTLSSALTFFMAVGITHLNVVLGLLVGGVLAAPFAARLAGKLPRKTMMIAVGVMVMIWCVRMIIKSFA